MWSFLLDFMRMFPYGEAIFVGCLIPPIAETLPWHHLMTEDEFLRTFFNTSLNGFTIVFLELAHPGILSLLSNQDILRRNEILVPFHPHILESFKLHLRLDSRLYLYEVHELEINLHHSYSFRKQLVTEPIGSWTERYGLKVDKKHTLIENRNNFYGATITAGSLPNFPFAIYPSSGPPTGYFEELLQILAEKMNFTHETQFSPDGEWGILNNDGQWNGLIKELIQKNVDVVIGGLSFTLERSLVIRYSDIIQLNYYSLIFPPSKGKTFDILAYVDVFTLKTWLGFMAFIIALLLLFIVVWGSPITENLLLNMAAIGSMLLQRGPSHPRNISKQIIIFGCSISGYFLLSTYAATLTSYMTGDPPPIEIKSLQGALDQGYEVLCRPSSIILDEILNTGPEFSKIAHRLLFLDEDHIFNRITDPTKDQMVYFGTPMWLQLRSEDLVTVVPEAAYTNHYFYGFQADSEIALVMDFEIRKLREQGILQFLQHKWLPSKNRKNAKANQKVFSLDILNVGFLFLVLGMGCLLSFCAFLTEKICSYISITIQ